MTNKENINYHQTEVQPRTGLQPKAKVQAPTVQAPTVQAPFGQQPSTIDIRFINSQLKTKNIDLRLQVDAEWFSKKVGNPTSKLSNFMMKSSIQRMNTKAEKKSS